MPRKPYGRPLGDLRPESKRIAPAVTFAKMDVGTALLTNGLVVWLNDRRHAHSSKRRTGWSMDSQGRPAPVVVPGR